MMKESAFHAWKAFRARPAATDGRGCLKLRSGFRRPWPLLKYYTMYYDALPILREINMSNTGVILVVAVLLWASIGLIAGLVTGHWGLVDLSAAFGILAGFVGVAEGWRLRRRRALLSTKDF